MGFIGLIWGVFAAEPGHSLRFRLNPNSPFFSFRSIQPDHEVVLSETGISIEDRRGNIIRTEREMEESIVNAELNVESANARTALIQLRFLAAQPEEFLRRQISIGYGEHIKPFFTFSDSEFQKFRGDPAHERFLDVRGEPSIRDHFVKDARRGVWHPRPRLARLGDRLEETLTHEYLRRLQLRMKALIDRYQNRIHAERRAQRLRNPDGASSLIALSPREFASLRDRLYQGGFFDVVKQHLESELLGALEKAGVVTRDHRLNLRETLAIPFPMNSELALKATVRFEGTVTPEVAQSTPSDSSQGLTLLEANTKLSVHGLAVVIESAEIVDQRTGQRLYHWSDGEGLTVRVSAGGSPLWFKLSGAKILTEPQLDRFVPELPSEGVFTNFAELRVDSIGWPNHLFERRSLTELFSESPARFTPFIQAITRHTALLKKPESALDQRLSGEALQDWIRISPGPPVSVTRFSDFLNAERRRANLPQGALDPELERRMLARFLDDLEEGGSSGRITVHRPGMVGLDHSTAGEGAALGSAVIEITDPSVTVSFTNIRFRARGARRSVTTGNEEISLTFQSESGRPLRIRDAVPVNVTPGRQLVVNPDSGPPSVWDEKVEIGSLRLSLGGTTREWTAGKIPRSLASVFVDPEWTQRLLPQFFQSTDEGQELWSRMQSNLNTLLHSRLRSPISVDVENEDVSFRSDIHILLPSDLSKMHRRFSVENRPGRENIPREGKYLGTVTYVLEHSDLRLPLRFVNTHFRAKIPLDPVRLRLGRVPLTLFANEVNVTLKSRTNAPPSIQMTADVVLDERTQEIHFDELSVSGTLFDPRYVDIETAEAVGLRVGGVPVSADQFAQMANRTLAAVLSAERHRLLLFVPPALQKSLRRVVRSVGENATRSFQTIHSGMERADALLARAPDLAREMIARVWVNQKRAALSPGGELSAQMSDEFENFLTGIEGAEQEIGKRVLLPAMATLESQWQESVARIMGADESLLARSQLREGLYRFAPHSVTDPERWVVRVQTESERMNLPVSVSEVERAFPELRGQGALEVVALSRSKGARSVTNGTVLKATLHDQVTGLISSLLPTIGFDGRSIQQMTAKVKGIEREMLEEILVMPDLVGEFAVVDGNACIVYRSNQNLPNRASMKEMARLASSRLSHDEATVIVIPEATVNDFLVTLARRVNVQNIPYRVLEREERFRRAINLEPVDRVSLETVEWKGDDLELGLMVDQREVTLTKLLALPSVLAAALVSDKFARAVDDGNESLLRLINDPLAFRRPIKISLQSVSPGVGTIRNEETGDLRKRLFLRLKGIHVSASGPRRQHVQSLLVKMVASAIEQAVSSPEMLESFARQFEQQGIAIDESILENLEAELSPTDGAIVVQFKMGPSIAEWAKGSIKEGPAGDRANSKR